MGWIEVRAKLKDGNSATINANGLEETITYQASADPALPPVLASQALTASAGGVSIPNYMDGHPTTPQLRMIDKQSSGNGYVFTVTCKYQVPKKTFEAPAPSGSSTRWNKSVSISGQISTEYMDKDKDGKVITNTLGDAFKPGLEVEFYDEVINISFNTRTLNVAALGDARGRVNSDVVTLTITKGNYQRSFPVGTLKLTEASYSTESDDSGNDFWNVNITLVYRHQFKAGTSTEIGWDTQVCNKGYRFKDGSGNIQKSYTEVYLKSDGTLCASTDTAYMLQFSLVDKVPFTGSTGVLNGI